MKRKRILFGAVYSSIEPLGLFHLSALADRLDWDPHIRLVLDNDFSDFDDAVRELKPDIVGFTIYSGGHVAICNYLKELKEKYPNIRTVVGGPHASYFPDTVANYVDSVVVGEGFTPLAWILNDDAPTGVLASENVMTFPITYRKRFYEDYPVFRDNPIKNIITMTGCPFTCTYCYNSKRIFPFNRRNAKDVKAEIEQILQLAPKTTMFSWQDDTLGAGEHKKFLEEFASFNMGLNCHGQTRWEIINPVEDRGRQVLELLQQIGFSGMTMAIESSIPVICNEVLNRKTDQKNIFNAVKWLSNMGFSLRTEQITGLPYGATSEKTLMNLDADLDILKLNMDLYKQFGLPNMAWATSLIPYVGTVIADYCIKYGFATFKTVDNPKLGYHERSRLRHLKEHIGSELIARQHEDVWLSEDDQKTYRDRNAFVRDMFHVFCYMGWDDKALDIIETYLTCSDLSISSLNLILSVEYPYQVKACHKNLFKNTGGYDVKDFELFEKVGSFCALLPGDGKELLRRFRTHLTDVNDVAMFSNVVKKYLFDTQVYKTGVECKCEVYRA